MVALEDALSSSEPCARTNPFRLLIRQRLQRADARAAGAQQGDVEPLHQARVATRRLREALPLVASGARGRKLERRSGV